MLKARDGQHQQPDLGSVSHSHPERLKIYFIKSKWMQRITQGLVITPLFSARKELPTGPLAHPNNL
jgi:hypothetical protein